MITFKLIRIIFMVVLFHLAFVVFFFTADLCASAPSRSSTPTPYNSPELNKSKAFALKSLLTELETNKVLLNKDLDECHEIIRDYYRRLGLSPKPQVTIISPKPERKSPSSNLTTCSAPSPVSHRLSPGSELMRSVWINNKTTPSPRISPCQEVIDNWLDQK